MTDLERNLIIKRRAKGESMISIATALGLSVNTVKSFCRREGIKPVFQPGADAANGQYKPVIYCAYCGTKLQQTPKAKPKRFCNDTCRNTWWNRERKEHPQRKDSTHTCARCGKVFHSTKARKYCSHPCYIADRFGGNTHD